MAVDDLFIWHRYFKCTCPRCAAKYDYSRALRCPSCGNGAVYPITSGYRDPAVATDKTGSTCAGSSRPASDTIANRHSLDMTSAFLDSAGVSACTECWRVPTERWLVSAVRVEHRLHKAFDFVSWGYRDEKLTAKVRARLTFHHLAMSCHVMSWHSSAHFHVFLVDESKELNLTAAVYF